MTRPKGESPKGRRCPLCGVYQEQGKFSGVDAAFAGYCERCAGELDNEKTRLEVRVKKLAQKYELMLDSDLEEMIKFIVLGGHVEGIENKITKSWLINKAIQFWGQCQRASTKHRAFEYLCSLLGKGPDATGTAQQISDVVIETLTLPDGNT